MTEPAPQDYRDLDDAALTDLFRVGDVGAMRFIVTMNNQRLFRAAWAVLNDRAEAEDAVQSAYVSAIAQIDAFEGRSKLSTWLTRIVVNEALSRRRRKRRREAHADLLKSFETFPGEHGNSIDPHDPEHEVAVKQLRAMMERAIAQLPDIYRVVFVLRELEDMTVEEVAAALDLLPATVKSRHFRARQALKIALAPAARAVLGNTLPFAGDACSTLTARVIATLSVLVAARKGLQDAA